MTMSIVDPTPVTIGSCAERASVPTRTTILLTVAVPLLGLIAAIALLWAYAFSWLHLALLLGMYLLTVLGVIPQSSDPKHLPMKSGIHALMVFPAVLFSGTLVAAQEHRAGRRLP